MLTAFGSVWSLWEEAETARVLADHCNKPVDRHWKFVSESAELFIFPERLLIVFVVIPSLSLFHSAGSFRSFYTWLGNPSVFYVLCSSFLQWSSGLLVSYVCCCFWSAHLFPFPSCFLFFKSGRIFCFQYLLKQCRPLHYCDLFLMLLSLLWIDSLFKVLIRNENKTYAFAVPFALFEEKKKSICGIYYFSIQQM